MADNILIEVAYASDAQQQTLLTLFVNAGCTVLQAITESGILTQHKDIRITKENIGIFGQKVPLTHTLSHLDRVEIYRPLSIDPKQARLLRANQ